MCDVRDRGARRNQTSNIPEEFPGAFKETFTQWRVFFAAERGELLDLLPLLAVQSRRHFDKQTREQITALAPVDVHDSFPAKFKQLAALRAGRHFKLRFALEGGHVHFATERGHAERNRHFAIKMIVLALEDFVFLDVNNDVKIAVRAAPNAGLAVARGTQARAIRDSGGNLQLDAARFFHAPFPAALPARFLDDLAGAATARTSL